MTTTENGLQRALSFLREGVVHECLLACRGRPVPVGCVRRGDFLHVRLFPGRTRDILLKDGKGTVHLVDDPVMLLTALEGTLREEGDGPVPRVPGCFASITVRLERREVMDVSDVLGETEVTRLTLRPESAEVSTVPPRPLSRSDGQLMEALVHATRARVSPQEHRLVWHERIDTALDVVQRTRPDGEELVRRIRTLARGAP